MTGDLSDFVVDSEVVKGQIGGKYTYEEVLLLLNGNCPEFKEKLEGGKVKKIQCIDINNNQGNISFIYKTTVEFENSDTAFVVILKVPTTHIVIEAGNTSQDVNEVIDKCHRTECNFYTLIHKFNDGFAPKVYYCEPPSDKHSGMIIMEDLSQTCTTFGLFRSGTIEQLWSVARKIAHYQAVVGCCLKKEDWMNGFSDDYHTDKFYSTTFDAGHKGLVEYEPSLKELVGRIVKVVSKQYAKYALIERPKQLDVLTLCHGDLWTNNMLYRKNEDGSISNEVYRFIDWQVAFPGNPFFDLVRYFVVAHDGDIRREVQPVVVEKFVGMLKEEYEKLSGGKMEVPFTIEQAQELFDLAFVEQTALVMIIPHFILNDKSGKHGEGGVLKAKVDKLVLKARLLMEDTLEVIERRGLDGFVVKISD